jgi:hypothetical protein
MRNPQAIPKKSESDKTALQTNTEARNNTETSKEVAALSPNEKDQKSPAATRSELKKATESQDLKKNEKNKENIPAVVRAKPNVEAYEVAKAHAMMEVQASEKKNEKAATPVPEKTKTIQHTSTGKNIPAKPVATKTKPVVTKNTPVKKTNPPTVKKLSPPKKTIEKKNIQKAKPAGSKTSLNKKPVVKQHASKPSNKTTAKKKVATKPIKKPVKKPVARKR